MSNIVENMFHDIEDLEEEAFIQEKANELSNRDDTMILDIYDLIPHERNRALSAENVSDLAKNIRLNGLLQYPIVKPDGNGKFIILAGHNRIAACKLNVEEFKEEKFKKIRCIVKNSDPIDSELILIDTNVKSNPLSPYDMMMALGRKEELLKIKKQNGELKGNLKNIISEESTLARSQVQTYLSIYKKATHNVKTALKDGSINLSQALKICKLSNELQEDHLEKQLMKKEILYPADPNSQYRKLLHNYQKSGAALSKYLSTLPERMIDSKQKDLLKFIEQMSDLLDMIINEVH